MLDFAHVIEAMAQLGSDVNNMVTGTNITPLIIAAARGHKKTVKTLIHFGAQILQLSPKKSFQMRKEQLDREYEGMHGSNESEDSNSFDNKSIGSSAFDFALQNSHNEIVECLIRELTLRNACITKSDDRGLADLYDFEHDFPAIERSLLPQKCGISEKESK